MNLEWSSEDLRFRDEVGEFLDAELSADMRAARRRMTSVYSSPELALAWQAILHQRGGGRARLARRIWRLRLDAFAAIYLRQ